jgi:hypothetical protein
MMGFNTISDKLFGGHNNVRPKPFIAPDADIVDAEIINKEFVNEKKPFIYTQNSQNNSERRNSEGFFTQRDNLDFSKSIFSPSITNNLAQASVSNGSFMPNRLSGNDSKYGSFSSFNSPNKTAQLGRELAFSA